MFNFNRKPIKNYLKIYGNMASNYLSDEDKKVIVNKFIQMAEKEFELSKLKFDISGFGYGISKGDSYRGYKSFKNKIDQKGYKNIDGIRIESKDNLHKFGLDFFNNLGTINRIEMYFSWPIIRDEGRDNTINKLQFASKFIKIDYAYAYECDKSLYEIGEGKISKGFFSTTVSNTPDELHWGKHIHEVLSGKIKKIYPINLFNKIQLNYLSGITPDATIQLNNSNEIWCFKKSNLKMMNSKATNKILNYK